MPMRQEFYFRNYKEIVANNHNLFIHNLHRRIHLSPVVRLSFYKFCYTTNTMNGGYYMNPYKNGIMGLVVGDALGVPYEFNYREDLKLYPCVDMIGYGTHNVEEGSWSDDSSMTLATLDSLRNGYNPKDIMEKFIRWYRYDEYTPFGQVFDIGMSTADALDNYRNTKDITTCGLSDEYNNGNGSLMRILPLCIYLVEQNTPLDEAIKKVHEVSSLTHAHMCSKVACGIYYFLVKEIMLAQDDLYTLLQNGIAKAFNYYQDNEELPEFQRLQDLTTFQQLPEEEIYSGGYVVDSLEASLWCLLNNSNYEETVLTAVNLGSDADTTAAIAGGLAGLYYTYDHIPSDWLSKIKRREYIEELCEDMQ